MTDAEICRKNDWGPGTRLAGDNGHGPTVIEITAIGDEHILARAIEHQGVATRKSEQMWTLSLRNWERIPN